VKYIWPSQREKMCSAEPGFSKEHRNSTFESIAKVLECAINFLSVVMNMSRMVSCTVLKREAPGLSRVPYPGELGQRIFDTVSEEGWKKWVEHQTMIINENGLSTMDPTSLQLLERHMLGFLFNEGDLAGNQFTPPPAKK